MLLSLGQLLALVHLSLVSRKGVSSMAIPRVNKDFYPSANGVRGTNSLRETNCHGLELELEPRRVGAALALVLAVTLPLLSCSSRNHDSDIPDTSSSTVAGIMTISGSPTGSDDVEDLRFDRVDTCQLTEDRAFTAVFGSERLSYKLELSMRNITEDLKTVECQQASTNTTIQQNDKDVLKFFGCYVSAMAGLGDEFNQYDTHRKDPQMSNYEYNGDGKAGCSIAGKIDLQSRIFEATEVTCKRMAVTIANGRFANPIYNDRSILLTARDLRCTF